MWVTLLVMAIAISLEPFRIGMSVLMLNRPRPMLQLLAFLGGGFAMGMTVGVVVLFVLRRRLLGSTLITLPRMQILSGLLAVLLAAALAIRAGGDSGPGRLFLRARELLDGRSLWVSGVVGMGLALPSVDYLSVLAVILASGAAATQQVGALLLFHIVAFALVEIPLIAYLLAPRTTRNWMGALNEWIRARRRIEVATALGGVGCVLVAVGIGSL
jgi:hypothetical protein